MAALRLMRPFNCLIASLSVILGALTACAPNEGLPLGGLWLAAASAFLIAGFGNALNDLFDLDTDRINRPERPLISGALTPAQVLWIANLLLLAGLACGRAISIRFFMMAVVVAVLLWAYNSKLKRTVLLGNVLVAFLTGFTLIFGGALAQDFRGAAWPALFAFVINLAREVLKDAADSPGDQKSGIITFPVRYGVPAALRVSAGLLVILLPLTALPVVFSGYGKLYGALVGLFVDLPVLVVAGLLLRGFAARRDSDWLNGISNLLKLIMMAGMVAVLVGGRGF